MEPDSIKCQVNLNNNPDGTSFFNNNLQANGQIFTNKITGAGDNYGHAQNLLIGDAISNTTLTLAAHQNITVAAPKTIYLNSAGDITLESTKSITVKAPSIYLEGQINNSTDFNTYSYHSLASPNINTTAINGFNVQTLNCFTNAFGSF